MRMFKYVFKAIPYSSLSGWFTTQLPLSPSSSFVELTGFVNSVSQWNKNKRFYENVLQVLNKAKNL